MQHLTLTTQAVTHQTYALLLRLAGRANATVDVCDDGDLEARDRGAVSLEQVLWFVAAGVGVGAISIILWGTLKTEAQNQNNVVRPAAP